MRKAMIKPVLFSTMPLWCFFFLPHTAIAQARRGYFSPLPAPPANSIWVIEQGKEPYTLPYDGATSLPGLSVYYGVIRNTDGSPAAGAGFYAQAMPIVKSDKPVQTFQHGVPLSAGPDGRFQFALKGYRSDGIFMMGSDGEGIFKRSQENFSLTKGVENVIVSRMKADLPAHLIKANRQAIDFNSTPTYTLVTFPAWNSLTDIRSLPPEKAYGNAEIYQDRKSTGTSFKIRSLAVPGNYSMLAWGRVFKPFNVSDKDTVLRIYEDGRPFTLKGRVQDPQGRPIPSAFVLVDNHSFSRDSLLAVSVQSLYKMWNETSGDFEKLGFYLAKTDGDGRYEIAGNTIGDFTKIYVFAEAHGIVERYGFLPDESRNDLSSTGAKYALPSPPPTNYSDRLFGGSAYLPPVVLARKATLKFELTGADKPLSDPDSRISCRVVVPSLKQDYTDSGWHYYKPESKDGATSITVPAGEAFEVVFSTAKNRDRDVISITNPLKPDEIRDLGSHALELKPTR